MRNIIFKVAVIGLAFAYSALAASKPNIIFIYADDMGYGDVQCLNPERGKISTPHMDKLADEGMVFTDAHTSSSVCTPSRYGLLTGRYNWRTELQQGVLWGFSEPLIEADRLTVPELLKDNGYVTAMFGKWHLGMIMPTDNGVLPVGRSPKSLNIVWDGEIKDGPVDRGFDHFFGISASLDMAPYIYIEDRHFVGAIDNKDKKMTAPGFDRSDVLPELGRKTVKYIEEHDSEKPFFVYVPLASPHTPILPTKEWQGKSGLGKYADFQMQTDHIIGQIVDAVDAAGLKENTLIIVSSDNGCSKAANIKGLEENGHYPSAQFRGSKADLWDGGHRVPFIVRWPAMIGANSQSNQTICLTDLMATCAEIVGADLPADAGEDSVSFLPAFKGEQIVSTRKGITHHSISGHFAYRQGKWKLLLAKASGGWTSPTEKQAPESAPKAQLYDMEADPGETNNLYETHPEVAAQLLKQLEEDVARGRSTADADQSNDIEKIVLWK
ncbi:MAG: arylsulfatase [Akkermansiaceae bacterium]|jgi:arylsulfatase A|nr:arylsulfatase [Akkermansiaceae bacterium]MDP4722097.1 arylsulfatase [Akkermansiaceae bacterium]MDP4781459.1 arylsulfatase [Akkermansiaceae bacterium]MDP4848092.1 arylsulfatase [Akkermansiaceae bacterium]MDP4899109.1 arylsulfatase [Akkermansiaceae bacterium]